MSQLLELTGYTVARNVLVSGTQIDIVAERHGDLASVRYLVECTDTVRTVGVKYVKEKAATLVSFEQKDALPCLVIVAASGFSAEARAFAEQRPDVLLLTIADLEAQLVDFSPYRNWYLQAYTMGTGPFAEAALHERYVQVSAESDGETVELTQSVKAWLQEPSNNVLFLLGDYGAGKTSFLRYLAYETLARRPAPLAQTPILVPLREYQRASNLRQVITDVLVNDYGVVLRSGFKAFERLCDLGRIALLLDGFDEMASRSDQQTLIDCFGQIFLLAETNAKVVVSCRSNFFRSHADVIKLLRTFEIEMQASDGRAQIASLGSLPLGRHGRVLTIAPLSEEQIAEYVHKRFPDRASQLLEQMGKIHDLTDLAKRPVLLDMILSTLPDLDDDSVSVSSANLYEIYTNRWARRDTWRVKLPLEARQVLCEALAWSMLAQGKGHFTYAELRATLAMTFQELVRDTDSFPDVVNDVQTCSFLVRAGRGDTYTMAHKSFTECFAGRTIAKLLSRPSTSVPKVTSRERESIWSPDVRSDYVGAAEIAPVAFQSVAEEARESGGLTWLHGQEAVVARAFLWRIEPVVLRELHFGAPRLRLDWDPTIERLLEQRITRLFGTPLHETRELPFELSPEIATFALEWLMLNAITLDKVVDVSEKAGRLRVLTEVMRLGSARDFFERNSQTLMEALSDPDPAHNAFVAAAASAVAQTSRVKTVDDLREIAHLVSAECLAVAMFSMAQGAADKRLLVRAYARGHASDLTAILGIYAARDVVSSSQYLMRLFGAAKQIDRSGAADEFAREIVHACTPGPRALVEAAIEVAAEHALDPSLWNDVVSAIKVTATVEDANRVKRLWMSIPEPNAARRLQRLERHLRGAAASKPVALTRSDVRATGMNERVWQALAKTR